MCVCICKVNIEDDFAEWNVSLTSGELCPMTANSSTSSVIRDFQFAHIYAGTKTSVPLVLT